MTYPDPHYDEDDTCPCPDHVAMRAEREDEPPNRFAGLLDLLLGRRA